MPLKKQMVNVAYGKPGPRRIANYNSLSAIAKKKAKAAGYDSGGTYRGTQETTIKTESAAIESLRTAPPVAEIQQEKSQARPVASISGRALAQEQPPIPYKDQPQAQQGGREAFRKDYLSATPEQRTYRGMGYNLEYQRQEYRPTLTLADTTEQKTTEKIKAAVKGEKNPFKIINRVGEIVGQDLRKKGDKLVFQEQRAGSSSPLGTGSGFIVKSSGVLVDRITDTEPWAIAGTVAAVGTIAATRNPAAAVAAAETIEAIQTTATAGFLLYEGKQISQGKDPSESVGDFAAYAVAGAATAKGAQQITKIISGRTPPIITAETFTTKREQFPSGNIKDTSKIKIEGYKGKSPFSLEGVGELEYIRTGEKTYLTSGKAEIQDINAQNPFNLNIKGTATRQTGGYDSLNLIKSSSGEKFISITKTADLIKSPFVAFKSRVSGFNIKGKNIFNLINPTTSVNVNKESYFPDILTGENIINKKLVGESGEIISSSYVLDSKGLSKTGLPSFNMPDLSRTAAERNAFSAVTSTNNEIAASQAAITQQAQKTTLPTLQNIFTPTLTKTITKQATTTKTQAAILPFFQIPTPTTQTYPQITTTTTPRQKTTPTITTKISPDAKYDYPSQISKQEQEIKRIFDIVPGTTPIKRPYPPIQETRPIQTTRPIQETRPIQTTRPIQETRPIQTTRPIISFPTQPTPRTTTPPPFTIDFFALPSFDFGGGQPRQRTPFSFSRPGPTQYKPTVKSLFYKDIGKQPKGRLTGLENRPIPTTRKKKKKRGR